MVESHKRRRMFLDSKREAIEEATKDMLSKNKPIIRLQQVKDAVAEDTGLDVDKRLVSQVLRKDMGLGYRLGKTVPIQSNDERCLVLR